jgi:hypothetical protein
MILRTFQSLRRVEQLEVDGRLVGCWEHAQTPDGYRAMVAAMARADVDTGGLPPIWAWRGRLQLIDAKMLLAEHELSAGYATVEFDAPAELTVESDYGAWNDYLEAVITGRPAEWDLHAVRADGEEPVQVCLPYLRSEWVRDVRSLPRTGWDEIDVSHPA